MKSKLKHSALKRLMQVCKARIAYLDDTDTYSVILELTFGEPKILFSRPGNFQKFNGVIAPEVETLSNHNINKKDITVLIHKRLISKTSLVAASLCLAFGLHAETQVGSNLNSAQSSNSDIAALYSGNRGTNGGGDQSLQFGDVLRGGVNNDLLVGGLGIDILLGGDGDDILVGGTEDFNGLNRDRAFGQTGDDSFLWAPGDGSDFFDGGEGQDVLFMTLIGEQRDADDATEGAPFFTVSPPGSSGAGTFDGIFESSPGVPVIDVDSGPGFCEIVEKDTENEAGLNELGLDHLVRFVLRGPRAAFDDSPESTDLSTVDNGLRVAIHLKDVEFLVCGGQTAGEIQIFDLRSVPAQEVDASVLPLVASELLSNAN